MLGRLEFAPGGRGKGERGELYGVPLLLTRADPEGWLGPRRVRRAARNLRRGGAGRVLLPRGIRDGGFAARWGLRPVLPDAFLRANAPELTRRALELQGRGCGGSTVALTGARADEIMFRTAADLCPAVRRLVIAVPGGEGLAKRLRWEFGLPVLPPETPAHLNLRLGPGEKREEPGLELYGPEPDLGGLCLCAPALREGERDDPAVLSVLWEWGKLGRKDVKIHTI